MFSSINTRKTGAEVEISCLYQHTGVFEVLITQFRFETPEIHRRHLTPTQYNVVVVILMAPPVLFCACREEYAPDQLLWYYDSRLRAAAQRSVWLRLRQRLKSLVCAYVMCSGDRTTHTGAKSGPGAKTAPGGFPFYGRTWRAESSASRPVRTHWRRHRHQHAHYRMIKKKHKHGEWLHIFFKPFL